MKFGSHLKAVVWDLDGTLVDSAPDIAVALNRLLLEHSLQQHSLDQVRTMIGGGAALLIERGFSASGQPVEPGEITDLFDRFVEIYEDCCIDTTQLRTGALETLSWFSQHGVRHGMCTNKPIGLTLRIIKALGVFDRFDSVIGGDSTAEKKPLPLPLKTCIEQMSVRPEQTLMVGDSAADVGAARALGMPVILVAGGYTTQPIETLGADHCIESLPELMQVAAGLPDL